MHLSREREINIHTRYNILYQVDASILLSKVAATITPSRLAFSASC